MIAASRAAARHQRTPQARHSLSSTGPARCFLVRSKENHERDGGHPSDSPSTAVRLRHLAGVYCLDSRDHRPFVLEFPASTGQPVPASSRAVQFVAYVSATHVQIISQNSNRDKRILSSTERFGKFDAESDTIRLNKVRTIQNMGTTCARSIGTSLHDSIPMNSRRHQNARLFDCSENELTKSCSSPSDFVA